MRRGKKAIVIMVVAMGVIALLAGCAPAEAPPVVPAAAVEKVPVGLNLSLTGGIAGVTNPVSYAAVDYFTYINDEGGFEYTSPVDGKVHHAMYDIMWADNGFSVARSMTIFKRFADAGAKFIFCA